MSDTFAMNPGGPDPVAQLIQALGRLPGIGEKSATRLAFYILREGARLANPLIDAIQLATERVRLCEVCMNFTDRATCRICSDPSRDRRSICVVESVQNLRAVERSGEFRGLYHVLHGVLSPLDGIGPDALKCKELLARLGGPSSGELELILATNPSVEGDATALYLQRLVAPLGIRVSRIASGMPIGGDLEYADSATICQAISGRRDMEA
jgi:recombination protein RecR